MGVYQSLLSWWRGHARGCQSAARLPIWDGERKAGSTEGAGGRFRVEAMEVLKGQSGQSR